MKIFRRMTAQLLALIIFAVTGLGTVPARAAADDTEIYQMLEAMPAKSILVCECTSGKVLFEKGADKQLEISHLAKLMTALLCADGLKAGELALDDTVTVSASANAKGGSQIWLDKNEKIRLEELLKAITVGNANDACTALAEHMAGSEEDFTALMNERAKALGMQHTYFDDCCGLSEKTQSTAEDMARLTAELLKHSELTPYFTCWLDSVRGGKAELVNRNRLVRSYKGILGLKACSSPTAGECAVTAAERNGLKIAVIVLGCDMAENRESISKKLMDVSFEKFSLYRPEIEEDWVAPIEVTGGTAFTVKVAAESITPIVIPKGTSKTFEITVTREETAAAPVKKGQKLGEITCTHNGDTVFTADLTAEEKVDKMNFKCGFFRLLQNLLSLNW